MQDKLTDAERIHHLGLSRPKGEVVSGVDVEKILKWAGFVYETAPDLLQIYHSIDSGWYFPSGSWYGENPPDILNSMDACIEYLEPVLFKKGYLYRLRRIYGGHRMQIVRPSTKGPGYEKVEKWEDVIVIIMDSKPAMAFSKAVERFIDSEIKQ